MSTNTVYSWTQEEIKDFVSRKLDTISNEDNLEIIKFLRTIIFSKSIVNLDSLRVLIDQYFPDYNFITQTQTPVVEPEEVKVITDILPNARQIQYECLQQMFR